VRRKETSPYTTPPENTTTKTYDKIITPIMMLDSCLLVDDSLLVRKILFSMLKLFFREVHVACNGSEAYEQVRQRMSQGLSYDYIFMDQEMPEMRGSEAILLIRQMKYTQPIISITGKVDKDDINDILASGANQVFPVPVKLDMIKNLISEGI
jgi:osomolarity two-component system sensor histidine kinase SLN1